MRRFILSIVLLAAIIGIGQLLNHLTALNDTNGGSAPPVPTDAGIDSDLPAEYGLTTDSTRTITISTHD